MKRILILFILWTVVCLTAYSQEHTTRYTSTDSLTLLRKRTAMAVLRTMVLNDEIIKADSIVMKTMESSLNRLNDSYIKVLGVNEGLKKDNSYLYEKNKGLIREVKMANFWLKVAGGIIVLETVVIFLK